MHVLARMTRHPVTTYPGASVRDALNVMTGSKVRTLPVLNKEGRVIRFETQVYRKDNVMIWVSISARSVKDPHGHVLYYEGSLMDITERKQAEAIQKAYQLKIEQQVEERTHQ